MRDRRERRESVKERGKREEREGEKEGERVKESRRRELKRERGNFFLGIGKGNLSQYPNVLDCANVLLNACYDIGLAVNIGKTKYIEVGRPRGV